MDVFEATGDQDVADWGRGVLAGSVHRDASMGDGSNVVEAHTVGITEAVLDLIRAGATHIGTRSSGTTNSQQLLLVHDGPTIEAGPNPTP